MEKVVMLRVFAALIVSFSAVSLSIAASYDFPRYSPQEYKAWLEKMEASPALTKAYCSHVQIFIDITKTSRTEQKDIHDRLVKDLSASERELKKRYKFDTSKFHMAATKIEKEDPQLFQSLEERRKDVATRDCKDIFK